ncbi:MAG: nucleotidyltransferase family protein [Candidatus Omnitrophica bacterium]|nr:nucleotidyltransferase family protein [Candidatus Omnitrophota bacterium]
MKALILAAGYATRLYPLTLDRPKCLLEVAGRPILDWLCGKLEEAAGLDEIAVVTNAKFFGALEAWAKGARVRVPVRVLNDGTTSNANRLGAIGDVGFALETVGTQTDLLVLAGDNIFDESFGKFISFAEKKKNAVSVGLHDIRDKNLAAGKYGVMETGAEGRVTALEEKPAHPKTSLIGMGIYYFPKNSLGFVREYLNEKESQDAPGHYIRWLLKRTEIFGFLFSGSWYDIGDIRSLEEAGRSFHQKI